MNAQPHPHVLHYEVDDEPQETVEKTLTPTRILELADIDPATHYLKQLEGKHQKSYKDDPNATIHMHEGMKFISVSTGPTPVS